MLSSLGATVEIIAVEAATKKNAEAIPSTDTPANAPSPGINNVPPAPNTSPNVAPPTTVTPANAPASPVLSASRARFSVSPMMIGILVVLGGVVIAMVFVTRWLRVTNDVSMLGNTVMEDTTCRGQFCLRGPGIEDSKRAKRQLVVAWRTGCIDDDYRAFLQGLAEKHPREIAIVAAGLAVPPSNNPRAFGRVPEPPPDVWPPAGCEPGIDVLPVDRGYASD